MRVSVLMPVFRRGPAACQAAGCFLRQILPDGWEAELVVLDDGGTFSSLELPDPDPRRTICLQRFPSRFPSLPAKYNWALDMVNGQVAVLFDDDDVYLPRHVELHVRALASAVRRSAPAWSKPSRILSDYRGDWQEEDGDGLFHGSIAFTLPCPVRWDATAAPDFDQKFMAALRRVCGPPRDPLAVEEHVGPQYCFRWRGETWHSQYFMGCEDWYERLGRAVPPPRPMPLIPRWDDLDRVLAELAARPETGGDWKS